MHVLYTISIIFTKGFLSSSFFIAYVVNIFHFISLEDIFLTVAKFSVAWIYKSKCVYPFLYYQKLSLFLTCQYSN